MPTPEPSTAAQPSGAHLTGGGITEPVIDTSVDHGRPRPVAEEVFDRLLASIATRAPEIEPTRVNVHWPHVGTNYRGTVILGQSEYGWGDDFRASEFGTAEGRALAISAALARNTDRADPNDWIATAPAKVRNSPFWTAARLVMDALDPDDSTPWYSRMCWMNLYPCAPEEVKGNPFFALEGAQDPLVGELLRAHVERLNARRVIAFTGAFWWTPTGPAGPADLPAAPSPLYRAGRDSDGRTWIVGMPPTGASNRGWGPTEYAELVVDAVREVEA